MKSVGLIRTVSATNWKLISLHGQILQSTFPFKILTRAIALQPDGVHDEESRSRAVPKVVAVAKEMAGDVEGIIISCGVDPGLNEVRQELNLPVVGAGAAGAAAALALGHRVGVLSLTPWAPQSVVQALGNSLFAVESPPSIRTTNELLTPTGVFESLDAGQRLADAGSDVILLASTGMTTMGIAGELRRRLGLPVVDGVLAAGAALIASIEGNWISPYRSVA